MTGPREVFSVAGPIDAMGRAARNGNFVAAFCVPSGWLVNSKDGSPMAEPPRPVLAQGKVRHVGDPVAVVIAETLVRLRSGARIDREPNSPLRAGCVLVSLWRRPSLSDRR